jgi:predicted ferric reductase
MERIKLGPILIILFTAITVSLYIFSKDNLNALFDRPFLSLGQITALLGTVLLSISFVLAGRFSFLEGLFGGLDKIYKTHHLTAGIAFILLLNHPIMLIVNRLPNRNLAVSYLLPSGDWSYNFGIFALWGFIFLMILTIYINLPYHLWKKTHELMGVPLLLATSHALLIKSDISRFPALRVWVGLMLFLGILSFLYKRFLYDKIGPIYFYIVDSLVRKIDVTEIYLRPVGKRMKFIPGQFAFLSFQNSAIANEHHPFSIASGPKDEFLRFCVKIVGDYTQSLRDLKKGDSVKVFGPYGRFSERLAFSKKDAVFIAGGIGVTPFLSLIRDISEKGKERKTFFFYCVKDENEAYYHNEIQNLLASPADTSYFFHTSKEKGRITAKSILEKVGNLKDKEIFLCGPPLMMDDLRNQFLSLGVRNNDILLEDFNLK